MNPVQLPQEANQIFLEHAEWMRHRASERDQAAKHAQAAAAKEAVLASHAMAQRFGFRPAYFETWRSCRPADNEALIAERLRLARRVWATVNAPLLLELAAALLCPPQMVVRWTCSRCGGTGLQPDPQVIIADGGSFLALVGINEAEQCAAACLFASLAVPLCKLNNDSLHGTSATAWQPMVKFRPAASAVCSHVLAFLCCVPATGGWWSPFAALSTAT